MFITALYILLISYLGLAPILYFPQEKILSPDYQIDTIKIGLLVQDKQSLAAIHGAKMAINRANLSEASGRCFNIEVRDMEGPWGTGAKETVNLVFGEDVWAVIGSVDGRNSHLAEQVSAKTHVPYISARAGDPTLAQAFVPWYFSCIPNDLQQASCIISFISKSDGSGKIVIISDDSYDSRMAAVSFAKRVISAGRVEPVILYYEAAARITGDIIAKIKNEEGSFLVIFGQNESVLNIIAEIRTANIIRDIFSSSLNWEKEFTETELKALEGTILFSPGYLFGKRGKAFSEEFSNIYGYKPGPAAAYAFDATNILIDAIINAGYDRTMLKKCISETKHDGITGQIMFDSKGNRMGNAGLMKVENNRPAQLFY